MAAKQTIYLRMTGSRRLSLPQAHALSLLMSEVVGHEDAYEAHCGGMTSRERRTLDIAWEKFEAALTAAIQHDAVKNGGK